MLKQKIWQTYDIEAGVVERISDTHEIDPVLANILANRGITKDEEIDLFMHPTKERLHDPYLLKDMTRSVERLTKAIDDKEQITIYGDYDVDGITSTSLLFLFLKELDAKVNYYIPDRHSEGYGINSEAIKKLSADGTQVIISVDTGIVAFEQADLSVELGIDMIITDHHEALDEVPGCFAVINPKRKDCDYPFDMLAGVGVTFKLVHGLAIAYNCESTIWKYLHIVAVGTIADIVPLVNENRIMTKIAFKDIDKTWNIGLKALIEVSGVKPGAMRSTDVGFKIGPRLNASGRLGDAKRGVALLTSSDEDEALALAAELDMENKKRQTMERGIVLEAMDIIERKGLSEDKIIVVDGSEWSHGVIGIVASRIMNTFYRPTIVLTKEDEMATGSARSVEGFNLYKALDHCRDLMTKFGGHEMAAGMSLKEELVPALRSRLQEYAEIHLSDELLIPKEKVDMTVPFDRITTGFVELVDTLEPYGAGNSEPIFMIEGDVKQARRIGKDMTHLKLMLHKGVSTLDSIGFSMADQYDYLGDEQSIRIIGNLSINEWQNRKNPQVMLKDLKYDTITDDFIADAVALIKEIEKEGSVNISSYTMSKTDFKIVYRYLIQMNQMKLYKLPIMRLLETDLPGKCLHKALLCMCVFKSVGLIQFELDYQTLSFDIIPTEKGKKVELEQSKLYNKLITE